MEKINIIRYQTLPDAGDENQKYIERVMAQLDETEPDGVRYAAFRLDDGVTFVHVVLTEGDADPLPQLPAFQDFQRTGAERRDGDPIRNSAQVIGAYRFFED